MRRRISIAAAGLWLLLGLGWSGAAPGQSPGQPPDQEQTGADPLAEMAAHVAETRRQAHAHPESAELWRGLITAESFLAAARHAQGAQSTQSAQSAQSGPGAAGAGGKSPGLAAIERVIEEWRAARPDDAGPYLAYADYELEGADREAYLLNLARSFPEQAAAVGAAADVLARRGEQEAASGLLEGFLTRHPDQPAAYDMVFGHEVRQGNGARAREVLSAWMGRFPDDRKALQAWLESDWAADDPEAARPLVERFAASPPPDATSAYLCGRLLDRLGGRYRPEATSCLRGLADSSAPEAARQPAIEGLARAAALGADWALFDWAIDRLPANRRAGIITAAASGLAGEESCDTRLALAHRAWDAAAETDDAARLVASALRPCKDRPEAQQLLLEMLTRAKVDQLPGLVSSWSVRVNGVLRTEIPVDQAAPILARRLGEEAGARELWQVLDQLYEASGAIDRRVDLLTKWIAAAPGGPVANPYLELAPLLLERGDPARAAALLEGAPPSVLGDSRLQEMLLGVYLATGEVEKAKALGARVLAESAGGPGESSAHLLLARAHRVSGEWAAAEQEYRAALAQGSFNSSIAREYLADLAATGDLARATAVATELCQQPEMRGDHGGAEECVADQMARLGQAEGSLAALQAALERAPKDAQLLEKLGLAAEQTERWEVAEDAFRRLVELDPASRDFWRRLGESESRRGRLQALADLAEASQRQFGQKLPALLLLLGKLYREQGQPRRSVDVLRELKAQQPDYFTLDNELRLSYGALGEAGLAASPQPAAPPPVPAPPPAAAPAAAPAPSGSPAQPGSPRQLLERAERLWAGLDGKEDKAAARPLFLQAAAGGDPLATLRLAIHLQLGRGGFERDPARAAELARGALPEAERLASAGDPLAESLVGTSLLIGAGRPADPAAALPWLRKAAEAGETWALHNLGWMYASGTGVAKDPETSAAWYRRAAEQGNAVSMYDVGAYYLSTKKDGRSGLEWMRKSAERNELLATSYLGKALLYGNELVAPQPEEAVRWLRLAAADGDLGAQYDLGYALLTGKGAARDRAQAAALIRQAAERGAQISQLHLGLLLVSGLAPGDPAEGMRWIDQARRSGTDGFAALLRWSFKPGLDRATWDEEVARLTGRAVQGEPNAQGLLAWLTFSGEGVEPDDARAVELARPAAEHGATHGMRVLGQAYSKGRGVAKDHAQAAEWYRRGAEAGNSFCMMWYSQALMKGDGAALDRTAGLAWLRRAGEAGNYWAIGDLGDLYDEGWYGLPTDLTEAARWKRKAAAMGDDEAKGWLLYHQGKSP